MRALVLYHSLFGNTREVAMSLANGLRKGGIETDCVSIDDIDVIKIQDYDFLAIGGPTHILGLSKEMKGFLKRLRSQNLRGRYAFSFDTRTPSRMNQKKMLIFENSAARRIEKQIKKMKMKVIRPRESAVVQGREGPLQNNTLDIFLQIGRKIAEWLVSQTVQHPLS